MPKFNVITWTAYDISKFSFYTKAKYNRSTMQNSRVMVDGESMYFTSSKDKNAKLASSVFYGVIEETFEIVHVIFKVPLFNASGFSITMVYKLMS